MVEAGVSYFGIGDLTGFDLETHKFESRYTERLVGPWPENRDLWLERSPILHVERISAPMLILQGLDDKVVPPSQAEQIVAALTAKGIPHAYVPDHAVNMAFLGSNTAGDWAVGDFWGPLGNETRAWFDHLVTGSPAVHTTPGQARINLETTVAIERAVATGKSVRLPLET